MKHFRIPACALVLSLTFAISAQDTPGTDELQKCARELEQKRQELLEKQVELLRQQLGVLKRNSPQSEAVVAMESLLDYKLSKERVRTALSGAKIVADDGTYLGRIGPTYDTESIFCSYGKYGATYSTKSIWCSYGKYGASYNELSPFCSYSSKPPKVILGGTVVASLTVGWVGVPVSLSPNELKQIFGGE